MLRPDVSAFILAGGQSTRMGRDKALVIVGGRTLLERVLETARAVTEDVRIVGEPAKYSTLAPTTADIFPGCGPLGGIHAALRASNRELNAILAVDVPFVTPELLQYLIACAEESPTSLVTVVRTNQGWQPLCAVYRREFVDLAEGSLRAGRNKIDALFEPGRARVISAQELQAAGFSENLFRNLNTPEELESASG